MKNKVESIKDYANIEKNDDVISLLKNLKELAYTMVDVQYKYWTMQRSLRLMIMLQQGDKESLTSFYKHFTNTVDVTKSQWGKLVPAILAAKETSNDVSRNKFLACIFLAGVDQKKYGKLVNNLNNDYLMGQKKYLKTVKSAMMMLSYYMGTGGNSKGWKLEELHEMSFAQHKKNVTCWKCHKKGHYANECKQDDSDDGSDTENTSVSLLSHRSG